MSSNIFLIIALITTGIFVIQFIPVPLLKFGIG